MPPVTQFEVLKSNARWRQGQKVPCALGAVLEEEGLGALHEVTGDGSLRLRARLLPGSPDPWKDRARKLAVLGHPNVVPLVGFGVLDGGAFVIEERPDGEPLRRWTRQVRAKKGTVSLEETAKVAVQVAGALRHAHDAGIFHGGLDAGSVNVARDGVDDLDVRVGGFGLAPGVHAQRIDLPAELWATLAPEAAEALASATVKSDLFAFGVLLVEMLTGSLHPAGGRQPWRDVALARQKDLPIVLAAQREDVPDGVWALIAGLLAVDPSARAPASARELARVLTQLDWEPKAVVKRETPQERASREPPPAPKPSSAASVIPRSGALGRIVEVTSRPGPGGAAVKRPPSPSLATEDASQTLVDKDISAEDEAAAPDVTVKTPGHSFGAAVIARRGEDEDRDDAPDVTIPVSSPPLGEMLRAALNHDVKRPVGSPKPVAVSRDVSPAVGKSTLGYDDVTGPLSGMGEEGETLRLGVTRREEETRVIQAPAKAPPTPPPQAAEGTQMLEASDHLGGDLFAEEDDAPEETLRRVPNTSQVPPPIAARLPEPEPTGTVELDAQVMQAVIRQVEHGRAERARWSDVEAPRQDAPVPRGEARGLWEEPWKLIALVVAIGGALGVVVWLLSRR